MSLRNFAGNIIKLLFIGFAQGIWYAFGNEYYQNYLISQKVPVNIWTISLGFLIPTFVGYIVGCIFVLIIGLSNGDDGV
ncbi:MAG: hypothetical protein QXP04_00270 [Candidatus Nanoarchaeia archaeon]|nr:hypothetical protein [Candidatus Jingweiarchaeum tengchongense]